MKYSLRAVKGEELSRIHFNADTTEKPRGMCRDVYERRSPQRCVGRWQSCCG
jgi:hypothetical protein